MPQDNPPDANRIHTMTRDEILALFAMYKFVDEYGHPLVNCVDLVDEVRPVLRHERATGDGRRSAGIQGA